MKTCRFRSFFLLQIYFNFQNLNLTSKQKYELNTIRTKGYECLPVSLVFEAAKSESGIITGSNFSKKGINSHLAKFIRF